MLARTWTCLRGERAASASASGVAALRRRLHRLRHSNRTAEAQLAERRRLQRLLRDERRSGNLLSGAPSASTVAAHAHALGLLPRNDALEASIALAISENRDARTELELMRRLVNSTLLSFASPVDRSWDPYDVKPQVFALDTYIALPVFTSLEYLRLFCQRFNFAVRDPSGALWAAAGAGAPSASHVAGLLPDAVVQSAWWQQRHGQAPHAEAQEVQQPGQPASEMLFNSMTAAAHAAPAVPEKSAEGDSGSGTAKSPASATAAQALSPPAESVANMDADVLFDTMLMDSVPAPAERRHPSRKSSKVRRRVRSARRTLRTRAAAAKSTAAAGASMHKGGDSADAAAAAAKAAYWNTVAQTAPFDLKQATPLPTFGPFLHPFLIGYFADVSTLLHNAAIVPDKVDIVLNPASPLEFVLSRAATDRVLHKDQLLHQAYLKVEKELQREFSEFFAACCPEVSAASSACVPLPMDAAEVEEAWLASQSPSASPRATGRHRARRSSADGASQNALQAYRERTRLLREAEFRNGVAYELVVLVQSSAPEETFRKIQQAKHRSVLMGHADLDVMPEAAAAPYVREMAHRFYDSASERAAHAAPRSIAAHSRDSAEDDAPSTERIGVFVRRGRPHTINVAQSADSYFHDPTNAYTEAHAVFTEELKVKRGQ